MIEQHQEVLIDYYKLALRDIKANIHLEQHHSIITNALNQLDEKIRVAQQGGQKADGFYELKNELYSLLHEITERTQSGE